MDQPFSYNVTTVSYTHLDVYKRQIINYTMLVLIDYVTVLLGGGGSIQEKWFLQALISKTVFIILMLFIRRFSKTRKSCGLITGKEWLQFFCVPVFTVVGFILMFYSENDDMQNVFLFLSVGLVAINLILMEFMQNTIEKEERIKIAVLTEQNQKNRIADYQDREEIYECQRRKMHDYKNQLSTIQTLIKNGHTDDCLLYTSGCWAGSGRGLSLLQSARIVFSQSVFNSTVSTP